MALAILGPFTVVTHLSILLLLIFLAGLFLGSRMMGERRPSMIYQYAFSVLVVLVAGALTTQEPVEATLLRIAASHSWARSWRCSCRRCSKRSSCPPAGGQGAHSY